MALPIVPPGMQVSLFYSMHDQGWSNIFYFPGSDYTTAAAFADAVNTAWLAPLTQYVNVKWGRISKTDVADDSRIMAPSQFATQIGGSTEPPMEAASAVLVKWQGVAGRYWNTYWHGFASNLMLAGGEIDPTSAAYTAMVASLADIILAGAVFPSVKGSTPGNRTLYAPTSGQLIRVLSHKVGRPFGVSRGRAASP